MDDDLLTTSCASKRSTKKTPATWTNSEAKKKLRKLLENDTNGLIGKMDLNEVHKLSSLFQPYDISKFQGYLKTLKSVIENAKKKPKKKKNKSTKDPSKWATSEAKKELRKLLENDTNGGIGKMDANEVHKLLPLFQQFNIQKFRGYLKTLKNSIAKEKSKPPSWGTSEAKKTLHSLLVNDRGGSIGKMDTNEVHKLLPLFQLYDIKKFEGYLKTLKDIVAKANEPKPPPWGTSIAKERLKKILIDDLDGKINAMDAAAVQMLSPLFGYYPKDRFKDNLENLKDSILREKTAVKNDEEFFAHDKQLIMKTKKRFDRGYPPWETSQAKKLLRKDVGGKKHDNVFPKKLWETRPEYMMFPLHVFRGHIHQEHISQVGRGYWLHKKQLNKDAKKKAKHKQQNKYFVAVSNQKRIPP